MCAARALPAHFHVGTAAQTLSPLALTSDAKLNHRPVHDADGTLGELLGLTQAAPSLETMVPPSIWKAKDAPILSPECPP